MPPKQTFIDHLDAIRKTIVWAIGVTLLTIAISYGTYTAWVPFLIRPLQAANAQLIITTLFEGFMIRLKLSIMLGMSIASPFYFYQLIRFLSPFITPKVKRVVIVGLMASLVLGAISFYLTYFRLLPFSVQVLTDSSFIPAQVKVMLHFNENITYVTQFLFYSILFFQFPVLLEVLLYFNILTRKQLWKSTRVAIVMIFIVAAIVTPTPDAVNQLLFAVPMMLLFFGTLAVAKIFGFGEG